MEILRYSAFTMPTGKPGGNPAGIVLDAAGLSPAAMQDIAADIGYSETAFLMPPDPGRGGPIAVRYFSPLAEVPFCGHATIALSVAHAHRFGPGALRLATASGAVTVTSADTAHGPRATLLSVEPVIAAIDFDAAAALIAALRITEADLDPALPLRCAFAGAWHPIVALADRSRLAALRYDYDQLGALMSDQGWTTIQVVHREQDELFRARNPFPPGGVVEDPATGAAAAALGGYLRDLEPSWAQRALTVLQGSEIGRPSRLEVSIPRAGGIRVSGSARPIG